MSDAFAERGKGLEEEYFHRKNKEAIEKLREKMKVAQEAKAAGSSTMICPRCSSHLKGDKFEGVSLDTCEKCGGMWLDAGELQQFIPRWKTHAFGLLLHVLRLRDNDPQS
jgi:hypothetical protein